MMVFDDIAKRKIRFQTRRGLLELDLIFGRFMEKEFEHLSDQELSEFSEILEFQDQELLALINGHSATDKKHLIPMLEKIRTGMTCYRACLRCQSEQALSILRLSEKRTVPLERQRKPQLTKEFKNV